MVQREVEGGTRSELQTVDKKVAVVLDDKLIVTSDRALLSIRAMAGSKPRLITPVLLRSSSFEWVYVSNFYNMSSSETQA